MPIYLDRNEFHKELTDCKKKDKLSDKAVGMFTIFAENLSRDYFFDNDMDREDAIQHAIMDTLLYWKNFKEVSLVQICFKACMKAGDSIIVKLNNIESEFIYYCKQENSDLIYREFDVCTDPKKNEIYRTNKTLSNFQTMVNTRESGKISVTIDKVKSVMTIMDRYNSIENSIGGFVKLMVDKSILVAGRKKEIPTELKYEFQPPPNSFSYFTSLIRHGILKSINKLNPSHHRNGKLISMDSIFHGGEQQSMFNI